MANQAIGDIILVTFEGLWHGQITLNTFYYRVNAVTGAPLVTAFATAMDGVLKGAGNLVPKFLACCPPQYFLNNIWYQTVAPTRYVKEVRSAVLGGTFASNSNLANTCTVITRRGDFANRRNVGALHVPMANLDADISNGAIGAPQLAANTALASQMLNALAMAGIGGADPVLWYPPLSANYTVVRSTLSQLTTRVMRRRTKGIGI